MNSWRLRSSPKCVIECNRFSVHICSLGASPDAVSCHNTENQLPNFVLLNASAARSMASWLVLHNLFVLSIWIASSSMVTSPEQGTNDSNALDLPPHMSDVTTLNKSSSLDYSWPATYAPTESAKINSSLTTAENAYNVTSHHLVAPRVQCKASTYGRGLNIASCQEAWELLPTSTTRRTIGQRTKGNFDIPLPFRVLSREYDHTQCAYSCVGLLRFRRRSLRR